MRYIVHEAPLRRAPSNITAMIDLEPFGLPGEMEQVWITPPSGTTAAMACVPFRAYGLALNDVVGLDTHRRRVRRLLRSSGHQAFRLHFSKCSEEDAAMLRAGVEETIERMGLGCEWSGDRHVVIDVPPGVELDPLEPVIRDFVDTGRASWEWSHVEAFRI
ncbi:DUF4265 domain-containing protein [Actinoplanes sp. NPDC026670]|jgi:hypothetical protein|uniref:DUF4265 domain-containing protein n=1 Tax=Actinoplanes sp. NPDC026670 TaxID=3154700 RepID=UPI0034062F20